MALECSSPSNIVESERVSSEIVCLLAKVLDELRDSPDLEGFDVDRFTTKTASVCGLHQAHILGHKATTRQMVVFDVCLPLLEELTNCYDVLDQVELQPAKSGMKPPPPPGMLSLRNYTDIACTMELCVCLGIMPHLEANILLPVKDRLRYRLPKSLAGRLPKNIILEELANSRRASREDSMRELKRVTMVATRLLLLDRFQPMLLPRHVEDMYAAILQQKQNCPSEHDSTAWLRSTSPIPPLLQARAFQGLLMYGVNGPPWLRKQVSRLLTDLAVVDLMAIIQVFVFPDKNHTAAAIRLAKTLRVCRQDSDFFETLYKQSWSFLRELDNQDASQAVILVQTVWAIFDVLPCLERCFCKTLDDDISPEVLSSLKVLFMSVPPSSNPQKMLECIMFRLSDASISFFARLTRLASASVVLYSATQQQARDLMRILTTAWMYHADKTKEAGLPDVWTIGLIECLSPLAWDANRFFLEDEVVKVISNENQGLQHVATSVEKRGGVLIDSLLSNTDDARLQLLSSRLLILLLVRYLDSLSTSNSTLQVLVPMVTLPMLCEKLSPDSLLCGDNNSALFDLMKIIFQTLAVYLTGSGGDSIQTPELDTKLTHALRHVSKSGYSVRWWDVETRKASTSFENIDVLLSLGTIVLTMLVGILELGAVNRTKADEESLQSFAGPLRCISELQNSQKDNDSAATVPCEVAEMASHALALLASRMAKPAGDPVSSGRLSPSCKLASIKSDLASPEPPLRARGVVQLRHIVTASTDIDETKCREILLLGIAALGDIESYVYLAAVHTISILAEVCPIWAIPAVATASIKGEFHEQQLSEEQRIKLTESMILTLRRKACLGQHSGFLIECMLRGIPGATQTTLESEIQSQTHDYFLGAPDDDPDEQVEEEAIRLNTGGPIFRIEETDTLRAGYFHIVAEVWACEAPLEYVASVIHACRMAIALDVARLVRRAGAYLARQLYATLSSERAPVRLAKAMVAGHESLLYLTLERSTDMSDLSDLEYTRIHDPATEARCREALELRRGVWEILSAGNVALSIQQEEEQHHIVKLLSNDSNEEKLASSFLIREL